MLLPTGSKSPPAVGESRHDCRLGQGPGEFRCRTRGRGGIYHRDRRARQGRRCPALPRCRHRRPGRQQVTFGDVWALLVDGKFGNGLPPAEPFPLPIHSGDVRVDVQAGLAMLAPIWGFQPLLDIDEDTARDQLARASVMALSYVAQSARGIYQPAVPQRVIDECSTVTARFMTRWQGEPDPQHVEAVDAYWVSAAEHGMNASTFTARVIASTGADVAASCRGRWAL